MNINTWFALILIGFILSPGLGLLLVGLYLFNYSTAVIFGLWAKYNRSYK